MDLKLTVFLSCLGITVLGSPPLLEEASGVVVGVRVEGVWRGDSGRSNIGRPIDPRRRRLESIIQDEPINKLEDNLLS